MKKFLSLALLFSMSVLTANIQDTINSADAEGCCNQQSCNPNPCTSCGNCPSCGCRVTLTAEEEAAGVQRCAGGCSSKPRPRPITRENIQDAIDQADAESCCQQSCTSNSCQKPCNNTCTSCGCNRVLTAEEEAAGVRGCPCQNKPKPPPPPPQPQNP